MSRFYRWERVFNLRRTQQARQPRTLLLALPCITPRSLSPPPSSTFPPLFEALGREARCSACMIWAPPPRSQAGPCPLGPSFAACPLRSSIRSCLTTYITANWPVAVRLGPFYFTDVSTTHLIQKLPSSSSENPLCGFSRLAFSLQQVTAQTWPSSARPYRRNKLGDPSTLPFNKTRLHPFDVDNVARYFFPRAVFIHDIFNTAQDACKTAQRRFARTGG